MSELFEVRFLPGDRTSRVPAGTTLFTAAHWIGVGIASTCGGLGTCGKCRVRIQDGGRQISSVDRQHLSPDELEDGVRLACAAEVVADTTCVAPEVVEIPRTAITGDGHEVSVEPSVRRVHLELDRPSEYDTRSDMERLRSALRSEGLEVVVDLDLLSELPTTLRRSKFAVSAVLATQELVSVEAADAQGGLLGVAFDVGTTTVVGTLVDLASGEVLAVDSGLNRQSVFGGDVISRIAYAMPGKEQRQDMQRAIVETMNRILGGLCTSAGVSCEHIYEALVVGNCTMIHLLLGVQARPISVAPFVPAFRDSVALQAGEIGLEIHPRGRVETFPIIGSYVGADTVAGLHATGLARQEDLWLFIDVGTNSEIALGSRDGVCATSAPAGPAFEGSCIRAGMVASHGAIERVVLGDEVELGIVGGGQAQGICGSGLIDTVAQLIQAGLLDVSGRLSSRSERADHPLASHLVERDGARAFALADRVFLSQRDIRELQSAKSSVATGVRVLLEHMGVDSEEVDTVLLAGSFGSSIDPQSARDLGLVPDLPLERIRFVGNVAAEGAKMALLSFRERQVAYDLARRVEYVELSSRADFNDLFVEGLAFPDRMGSVE